MKKLSTFLKPMTPTMFIHVMLMSAVLLSCSKDEDATPKPEPVISMKVDGAEVTIMETTSQIVTGYPYTTLLQIDGTDETGSQRHVTLFFASEAIMLGEDIDLSTDDGRVYIHYKPDNGPLLYGAGHGWGTQSGHVMVQEFDLDKKTISGTFSAELKDLDNMSLGVTITEGKFNVKFQ